MANKSNFSKKYKQLGLRRDRNLSDVSDKTAALNNLLNNIVSDPTGSFVSEDLDAIRGLQGTSITSEKLATLSGAAVIATSSQNFINEVVQPPVRLIDRVKNINTSTGGIPSFRGGDGLMARFVPSADINQTTAASTGDTAIIKRDTQFQEIFWDNGIFSFGNTIDPSFANQYGGIQWTGYFVPDLRDPSVNLYIDTTGLIIAEVDLLDSGTWTTFSSIYSADRAIVLINVALNAPANSFTLSPNQRKHIGLGDFVKGTDVTVVAVTDTTVTLSGNITLSDSTLILTKVLGETTTSVTITLPAQSPGTPIKVRFTYWYPDTGQSILEKTIRFRYIGAELQYTYLYDEKPKGPGPLEIRQFLLDAVTPSQNSVGTVDNYKNVYVTNSLLLNEYSPLSKTTFPQIRKAGPGEVTFNSATSIISGAILGTVEAGNIIAPASPGIFVGDELASITGSAIKSDISTTTRISNKIWPHATRTAQVNIIDHRGFIGWYQVTGFSQFVTINLPSSTKDLAVGYLVMTNTSTGIFRITSIQNTSQFTTSPPLNLSSDNSVIIYVYSDRGLVDRTKEIYCEGVFGKLTTNPSSAGATVIAVTNLTGISVGQVVQFTGPNPVQPIIPVGTVVSGIIDSPSSKLVVISNALSGILDASITVTFAPAGTIANVESCILPLDNSPPFVGTDTGLSTSGKGIIPVGDRALSVSASRIEFSALSTSNITPAGTPIVDRVVKLSTQLNGVLTSFSILGSSS